MDITNIIISLLIGAVAGWLAGFIVPKSKGGLLWNIIIGLIGGFIGGNVLGWFGISWGGTIGAIGTAVVGAVILIWIVNLIKK